MSDTKIFVFLCLFLAIVFLISFVFKSCFFSSKIESGFIELQGRVLKTEPDKIVLKTDTEKVLVFTFEKFNYGDVIFVRGEAQPAPVFDDFNYKEYLKRKGIFRLMHEPEIEIVSKSRFSIYKSILGFRKKMSEKIEKNYNQEQASLLKAMLLGIKTDIPDSLKEKLNKSGIRHLTAISGMHTIILVNALMYLFLAIGLWRRQAFILTLLFIFLFIILTGFQPSTIRASIMAGMLLLAQAAGRLSDSTRAIVLTALIMLAIKPLLLFVIGFQLSFLAVLGINYLTPILSYYLRKLPKTGGSKNILIMTLSVQLFTLPILIYNFGYISLIAPITNLLILPILPFILILGFLSLFLGITFVIPTHMLLTYLIKVSEIFSSFTFSSINLRFSVFLCVLYYLFLIHFICFYRKKNRFRVVDPLI